mmetsp:Transcript_23819/g.62356  ORF Transcript_23819/g.62356 Transcript_23819/m.62356 type:complete len:235 (-) Transcript_23819:130-834(-)
MGALPRLDNGLPKEPGGTRGRGEGADALRPRRLAPHGDPRGIAPKGVNVVLDPPQRLHLVGNPVHSAERPVRLGANRLVLQESERAEAVVDADHHHAVRLGERRAVPRPRRPLGQPARVDEDHDGGTRSGGRCEDVELQAVLPAVDPAVAGQLRAPRARLGHSEGAIPRHRRCRPGEPLGRPLESGGVRHAKEGGDAAVLEVKTLQHPQRGGGHRRCRGLGPSRHHHHRHKGKH